MTTTLREQAIDTVHDHVVELVAQRWAKAFVCKATIRTHVERTTCLDTTQDCDIVGWYVSSGGNTMEWMAEVETEESLANIHVADKWRRAFKRGIPFFLLVPCGRRDLALKLTEEQSIAVSWVYEFTFINGVVHLL